MVPRPRPGGDSPTADKRASQAGDAITEEAHGDPECRNALKGFRDRYWIVVAGSSAAGAFLLAAIAANLGFSTALTAPGLMAIGGGFALVTSSVFLQQIQDLKKFKRD